MIKFLLTKFSVHMRKYFFRRSRRSVNKIIFFNMRKYFFRRSRRSVNKSIFFNFLSFECAISELQYTLLMGRLDSLYFLCWYQEYLCPVEPMYFSDEKSSQMRHDKYIMMQYALYDKNTYWQITKTVKFLNHNFLKHLWVTY